MKVLILVKISLSWQEIGDGVGTWECFKWGTPPKMVQKVPLCNNILTFHEFKIVIQCFMF